jgi:hypothetical protein
LRGCFGEMVRAPIADNYWSWNDKVLTLQGLRFFEKNSENVFPKK